jgi:hypothetical protein
MFKRFSLSILALVVMSLLINSCTGSNSPVEPPSETGSVFITSYPSGAAIYINNIDSGLRTPDTVHNVDTGKNVILLSLSGYRDTSISATVIRGQKTIVPVIELTSTLNLFKYYTDTIWTVSNAYHNCGLSVYRNILASMQNPYLDLYYYTNNDSTSSIFEIRSASVYSASYFTTKFIYGGNYMKDTVSAPVYNASTWSDNINVANVDTNNYYFGYTQSGNYFKLKVSSTGGGTSGHPSWIILNVYYNNVAADRRFR